MRQEPNLSITTAEQTLLRTIEELEAEIRETKDRARAGELSEQISALRDELSKLQGPAYSELEQENRMLKQQLSGIRASFDSFKASQCETPQTTADGLRARLHAVLLSKYSSTISDLEKKTVGEIKALVNGEDLSVQSRAASLKPEDYDFERDYLTAAKAAFEFITANIDYVDVSIDINFWLTPTEILSTRIGDDEDLAVLLCSLLCALGDSHAEVVIAELDSLKTHAFVITNHSGKFLLLDPPQKQPFEAHLGERGDVLIKYSFEGARIKRFLYRFNSEHYEQFL